MTERVQGFWMGALTAGAIAAVASWAPGLSASSAVARAESEPKYTSRIVLENDRVRVRDVTFPPGVIETGMHTHELPHVGVILTKGALVFSEPGGSPETVQFEPGMVGFREADVTHQVGNPGSEPMRVIEVELK